MESIQDKYQRIRPEITDACMFLMSRNRPVSKIIRWSDNADFSHIGLIFEKVGRFLIIDSNSNGVHPELLSVRIDECDNFLIIKPLCSIDIINDELCKSFTRASLGIKYDFKNGLKELVNRKFHTSFKIKSRDEHDICSDWVREQAIAQGMLTEEFKKVTLPFPQDYLRYVGTNVKILN